jgi:hypothetical protein
MRRDPEAQAARERGETFYFLATSCSRGHMAKRWVCNGGCAACVAEKRRATVEVRRQRDRQWRAVNPEKSFERNRKWRVANPGAKNALVTARKVAVKQRTPAWSDLDQIKAFYRLAAAFSKLYVPHHVDHIIPLNGKTVSGLHVPLNLRVIPATDNLHKSAQLLLGA